MKYSFKCTCGHVMTADAANREEAVVKLKAMMTPDAITEHMTQNHPGEPAITQEQVYAGIEQGTVEGDLSQQQPAA